MNYWIGPANPHIYSHDEAFSDLDSIDWINSRNFSFNVGDIVYIYISKNSSKTSQVIKYITEVTRAEVSLADKVNDEKYWHDKKIYNEQMNSENSKFVRLKLIDVLEDNIITLQYLRNNGLKGNIQSFRKLDNELINAIQFANPIDPKVQESNEKKFLEGQSISVPINRYERNPRARKACLEHYGYDCRACGINFYRTYGEKAKNFIHVHHIIPISEVEENSEIDPIKDLIPLCPNCHAMVHKDIPLEELKKFNNYTE